MKYKTLDWIGRIPLVVLFYALIKASETPTTPGVLVVAVVLVVAQFTAIGRCIYLGHPEAK